MKRILLFVMAAVIALATLSSTSFVSADDASGKKIDATSDLQTQFLSYFYFRSITSCITGSGDWDTNISEILDGRLWKNFPAMIHNSGAIDTSGDGVAYCDEPNDSPQLTNAALKSWGIDNLSFVCNVLKFTRTDGRDCTDTTGTKDVFKGPDKTAAAKSFSDWYTSTIIDYQGWIGGVASTGDSFNNLSYINLFYFESDSLAFNSQCSSGTSLGAIDSFSGYTSTKDKQAYWIIPSGVDASGKLILQKVNPKDGVSPPQYQTGGRNTPAGYVYDNKTLFDSLTPPTGDKSKHCYDLYKNMYGDPPSLSSGTYKYYYIYTRCSSVTQIKADTALMGACWGGGTNGYAGTYNQDFCKSTFPKTDGDSGTDMMQACYVGQGHGDVYDCQNPDYGYTGVVFNACLDGSLHPTDTAYCDTAYGDHQEDTHKVAANPDAIAACKAGQTFPKFKIASTIATLDGSGAAAGASGATSTCNIPQVGWIACPIMTAMGGILDGIFGVIENLLKFSPKFVSDAATKSVWQTILNFANAGLVIVFIVIIFSQITGLGIGNYGIKKMLPRLIIAAIVMQISMWLCALAIDLSNILGSGVYGILDGLASQSTSIGSGGGSGGTAGGVISVALIVAAVIVLTGAALWGAFSLLLPVILAAVVAVALTLGILIARIVIIILLIILAPIAILAMVLPNTENIFKTWRKWLVSMLLLYPMVALLYGGAKLAGGIFASAGTAAFGGNATLVPIIQIGIMTLPLFFTPKLLQGSLNAIPAIGNAVGKLASRQNSSVSKAASTMASKGAVGRGLTSRREARLKGADTSFAKSMASDKATGKMTRFLTKGVRGTLLDTDKGKAFMKSDSKAAGAARFVTGASTAAGGARAATKDAAATLSQSIAGETSGMGASERLAYHSEGMKNLNPVNLAAHTTAMTRFPEGVNELRNLSGGTGPIAEAAKKALSDQQSRIYELRGSVDGPTAGSSPSTPQQSSPGTASGASDLINPITGRPFGK